MLPEIRVLRPDTLPQALQFLAVDGARIRPLAGGTNVVVELREQRHCEQTLMDLARLHELRGVTVDDGQVVVGAGTTISDLLDDPLVARFGAPLRQAASRFANPLVRNRATIGGNIIDASPAADTLPPLLALGAEVELGCRATTRRVALDEFLVGVNSTMRRADELLLAVRWPIPPERSWAGYHKIGLRRGTACSVISAAVMVSFDQDGRCAVCRIALGAVAVRPLRCAEAESALSGKKLTAGAVAVAAALAAEAASPIDDIRGSAAYRRQMAEVLVRRLLLEATPDGNRGLSIETRE